MGAPGAAGHRTGLPPRHRGDCLPRSELAGLQAGLTGTHMLPHPILLWPSPPARISQRRQQYKTTPTSLWPETAEVYLRLVVHEHLHSALFTFICAPSKRHTVYIVVTKHNCSRHRTNFPASLARPGHAAVTTSHRRLGLSQSLGVPGCCRSHGLESGQLSCQLWRALRR